ncbi:PREDICTED: dimethyladenosine transferase 2, mitochondrial [Colobus angolensis palliatus]|uniref:dimethyladenosine transferase 2, mitochondrial n=1 Tax=Colobus angolensis palliatus TaxID=336983 RepID=UPI0005F480C8|nr:PREDICTED: dimethyladenosine transferase 2, mitochondrial [Colobus angolensis palliatus]
MWIPVARLPPRLRLSALAGAGRFCILGSGAATRKHLPARNRRGLSDCSPQLLPEPDFRNPPKKASRSSLDFKRYVTDRRLAETLAQIVCGKPNRPPHLLLECNPGESCWIAFSWMCIIYSNSLGKNLDGKLRVIYCDFFRIDPRSGGAIKPPAMSSEELFKNLGIEEVPWTAGIPLKVFGMFPSRGEKRALWKLAYDLYSCTSIYKFGRIEINMFIGEKEFQRLLHCVSAAVEEVVEVNAQCLAGFPPLSWTRGKLLRLDPACGKWPYPLCALMEPWSSFDVYTRSGRLESTKRKEVLELLQQKLYLVQMTPRQNLFADSLTPMNYNIFFHLLKHCFGRRTATVIDHLRSLTPLDARDILMQIGKEEDEKVVNMHPQDFKRLFETIECSEDCAYKWLYDETLEDM